MKWRMIRPFVAVSSPGAYFLQGSGQEAQGLQDRETFSGARVA
jgi:hypothetical protein